MSKPDIHFIADDFGLSTEVNETIFHTFENGALTGAALMMGQLGTQEAVQIALKSPELQVGLHFHLCDSHPMKKEKWPWETSPVKAGILLGIKKPFRELIRKELKAQWKAFQETGLECRFINVHHHLHAHPFVLRELENIVGSPFQGWIRLGAPCSFSSSRCKLIKFQCGRWWFKRLRSYCSYNSPETLWGIDRTFRMQAEEVVTVIKELTSGSHEFIFHPRQQQYDRDTECLIQLKQFLD